MAVDTKEVVTTISYLIGVRKDILELNFAECKSTLDKLYADRDATVIRYLCKLRTALLQHFKKTDTAMRYDLKNLTSIEWYDKDNIRQLEKWGIPIIQANYRSEKYMHDFTRLINENIDKCSHLFYDWIIWEYIRDLFYIPKYQKAGVLKEEFDKYMKNIQHYPFQMYIHWKPADVGNIIYTDRKFLKLIYEMHGDVFTDYTKYRDADDETRNNIYGFIDSSDKTAIAVDCENSNPFKLYSVLKGLNQDELSKIEKITLYDDPNTTAGWDWLSKFTMIPVEHIEIERVSDRKSLVDVRMTASVVTDFYRDGITSFIIVSSDSDFWGLIKSLPDAQFLVMYEYEKIGSAIQSALTQHGIYYCAIDDFCSAATEDMKRAVLFAELEKHFPTICGENPLELTHKIYEATRVTATKKEMENFCTRYVKTLRLKLNSEGKFVIEIQK
ncbi:MAG: NYN domain-containing protein [Ruminococcus sp.]|uniref:NYN domain-containing protein n=1 Tax=Ruminococcus sp. TaxID=41978 RepID=UPI0025D88D57|nr:NYN domain-containing protein [Ruminococcus sp.]MBO4865568.1 NYN domain-containing protein [Ruminococcus sp.]